LVGVPAGLGVCDGRQANQTAVLDFGHSCARVPELPHIAAYPRVFLIAAFCGVVLKALQIGDITAALRRRLA
jgi:hypothetical protein